MRLWNRIPRRNLRQRRTQRGTSSRYRLGPSRRPSPRRPRLPKAAPLDNLARAVVAVVGADDVNLRFKVRGSRFPVLKLPVRNPIFRTPKGLLLSKILENQRMRTMNRELEP